MPVVTTISLIPDSQDPSGLEAVCPSVSHLRAWKSGCSFLEIKKAPSFSFASWGSVQKAGLVLPYTTKVAIPIISHLSFLSPSHRDTSSLFEGFGEAPLSHRNLVYSWSFLYLWKGTHFGYQSKTTSFDFSYISITPLPRRQRQQKRQCLE